MKTWRAGVLRVEKQLRWRFACLLHRARRLDAAETQHVLHRAYLPLLGFLRQRRQRALQRQHALQRRVRAVQVGERRVGGRGARKQRGLQEVGLELHVGQHHSYRRSTSNSLARAVNSGKGVKSCVAARRCRIAPCQLRCASIA